jgi:hypothetical protein
MSRKETMVHEPRTNHKQPRAKPPREVLTDDAFDALVETWVLEPMEDAVGRPHLRLTDPDPPGALHEGDTR